MSNQTTYQKNAFDQEQHQLRYFTDRANSQQVEQVQDKRIVNLSLLEIAEAIATTFIEIVNDLLDPTNYSINGLITVFFRDDRMIYLGIVLMIVCFSLYLIDVTS